VSRKFDLTSWIASRQRPIELVLGGALVVYLVYVLVLSKVFSASVAESWFRDLGILWTLSDHVFEHHRYLAHQYFFPPPNAIIVHAYGSFDRELAFRLYVVLQIACFLLSLWMWSRYLDLERRPARGVIVAIAVLTTLRYIHVEFAMHNVNLVGLALVSAAVLHHQRRAAAFWYALSLAIKPYSSVLILPWMMWRGLWAWSAQAMLWLLALFALLPIACFGLSDTVALYRDWVSSLTMAGTTQMSGVSVRAGFAALFHLPIEDSRVVLADVVALGVWVVVVAAFFLPTLLRKAPTSKFTIGAELAAILLVALPVGAHQQPARGVALVAATLVIAAAAFAEKRSRWSRIALLSILAAIGVSVHVVPLGPLFFLLTLPVCMAALAGLAIARHEPGRP
jgi:hypothetical protein